jgi:hypothetical protein
LWTGAGPLLKDAVPVPANVRGLSPVFNLTAAVELLQTAAHSGDLHKLARQQATALLAPLAGTLES